MEVCAVICRKATFTLSVSAITLPDANFPTSRAQNRGFCALLAFATLVFGHFEHKIEVFVRFWLPKLSFSGLPSTKLPFLCSFTKLDVGLGDFPAERGIVAPAEPLHLRCRCTSAAYTTADATTAAPAQPSHLRSRRTCGAAASAQPILPQPTPVAPAGACGLGYHSGLGGGVEDVVD